MMRSPSPRRSAARESMWAAKPWAVRASATACIADRSDRCPVGQRVAGEPGGHRPAVRGADLLGHRLGVVVGQAVERPAEQRQHEVVAAHRDAGVERRRGDGDVALRRAARPARTACADGRDDLDVPAGGELVEVVAGDVGMHPDLGGDRRRGDAVGAAVVACEQVDPPAGRVAEGVGDRRHGRGERRALGVGGRLDHAGILPMAIVQIPEGTFDARQPRPDHRGPAPGAGPRAAPIDRRPRHGARGRRRPPTAASRSSSPSPSPAARCATRSATASTPPSPRSTASRRCRSTSR